MVDDGHREQEQTVAEAARFGERLREADEEDQHQEEPERERLREGRERPEVPAGEADGAVVLVPELVQPSMAEELLGDAVRRR